MRFADQFENSLPTFNLRIQYLQRNEELVHNERLQAKLQERHRIVPGLSPSSILPFSDAELMMNLVHRHQ